MSSGCIGNSWGAGWRKGQVSWTHFQWWHWQQLESWLKKGANQLDTCPVVALITAGELVGGRGKSAGHISSGGIGNSWSAGWRWGKSAGHMSSGGIDNSWRAGWRKGQVSWSHVQWWYWKQLECWLREGSSQQDTFPVVALETT